MHKTKVNPKIGQKEAAQDKVPAVIVSFKTVVRFKTIKYTKASASLSLMQLIMDGICFFHAVIARHLLLSCSYAKASASLMHAVIPRHLLLSCS